MARGTRFIFKKWPDARPSFFIFLQAEMPCFDFQWAGVIGIEMKGDKKQVNMERIWSETNSFERFIKHQTSMKNNQKMQNRTQPIISNG